MVSRWCHRRRGAGADAGGSGRRGGAAGPAGPCGSRVRPKRSAPATSVPGWTAAWAAARATDFTRRVVNALAERAAGAQAQRVEGRGQHGAGRLGVALGGRVELVVAEQLATGHEQRAEQVAERDGPPAGAHDRDGLRAGHACGTAAGRRRAAAGRAGGWCRGRGRCRRRPRRRARAAPARCPRGRARPARAGTRAVTSLAPIMMTASSGRASPSTVELRGQLGRLGADDRDVDDVHGAARGLGDAEGELRGRGVAVAVHAVAGRGRVAETATRIGGRRGLTPARGPGGVVRDRRRSAGERDAAPGEPRLGVESPNERGRSGRGEPAGAGADVSARRRARAGRVTLRNVVAPVTAR